MAKALEKKIDETFDDADYEAAFNDAAGDDPGVFKEEVKEEIKEEIKEEVVKEEPELNGEEPKGSEPEPKTTPEVQRLEAQLTKMETLLAEAAKRAEEKPVEKPVEKSKEAEDDEAALLEVQTDWPTIYKVMESKIKRLEKLLEDRVSGVETKIKGEMAPVMERVEATAQEKFLSTIVAAHPDSRALLPEVEKWIDTQPKFLQSAYNAALDEGTAQDVIDLYTTFKTATGKTTVEKAPEEKPKDEGKSKRLRQMEGVKSERTSATALDEDDFEGAFNRAAQS